MAPASGSVPSAWSVAVSAGRAGRSRCAACARKNCKFCCTGWRPRHDATGSAGNFPPLLYFRLHFSLDSIFPFCHTRLMPGVSETAVVQGREVSGADREQIRELIRAHPDWSRRRLSEVLAAAWDWRNVSVKGGTCSERAVLLTNSLYPWRDVFGFREGLRYSDGHEV